MTFYMPLYAKWQFEYSLATVISFEFYVIHSIWLSFCVLIELSGSEASGSMALPSKRENLERTRAIRNRLSGDSLISPQRWTRWKLFDVDRGGKWTKNFYELIAARTWIPTSPAETVFLAMLCRCHHIDRTLSIQESSLANWELNVHCCQKDKNILRRQYALR